MGAAGKGWRLRSAAPGLRAACSAERAATRAENIPLSRSRRNRGELGLTPAPGERRGGRRAGGRKALPPCGCPARCPRPGLTPCLGEQPATRRYFLRPAWKLRAGVTPTPPQPGRGPGPGEPPAPGGVCARRSRAGERRLGAAPGTRPRRARPRRTDNRASRGGGRAPASRSRVLRGGLTWLRAAPLRRRGPAGLGRRRAKGSGRGGPGRGQLPPGAAAAPSGLPGSAEPKIERDATGRPGGPVGPRRGARLRPAAGGGGSPRSRRGGAAAARSRAAEEPPAGAGRLNPSLRGGAPAGPRLSRSQAAAPGVSPARAAPPWPGPPPGCAAPSPREPGHRRPHAVPTARRLLCCQPGLAASPSAARGTGPGRDCSSLFPRGGEAPGDRDRSLSSGSRAARVPRRVWCPHPMPQEAHPHSEQPFLLVTPGELLPAPSSARAAVHGRGDRAGRRRWANNCLKALCFRQLDQEKGPTAARRARSGGTRPRGSREGQKEEDDEERMRKPPATTGGPHSPRPGVRGEHLLSSNNWVLKVLSSIRVTLSLPGTADRRWGLLGTGRTTHQREALSRARPRWEGVSNGNPASRCRGLLHRAPPCQNTLSWSQTPRRCRAGSTEELTPRAPGLRASLSC